MQSKKLEKRVSFIVTTKNRAQFFERTLHNISEFITPEDELIIIDGGSTDGTEKLVKKYKKIVSIFKSEPDFGEAHALNKGILLSTGKFIKVLTDDDYIFPKAMKKAIATMEKHPEIDAVQCGGESYMVDEKTGESKILYYPQVFPGVEIAHDLIHVTTYCPCGLGLILTSGIISRAGLFDTNFRAVDLNYISKLIAVGANFKYLNLSLYKHFWYPHSGQKYADEIHRDEARVFIDHALWERTMQVETPILEKVLGLDQVPNGQALLQSLKLLDFLRRKGVTLPIQILAQIARQHKRVKDIKNNFKRSKPVATLQDVAPVPPKRDGKFW